MIWIIIEKFFMLRAGFLLRKIKYFSLRPFATKWFESYLSNCKFFVCIDQFFSETERLTYGVPQCSILGLLLLLSYAIDYPQSISEGRSHFHENDTRIFSQLEND